jgi:GTP-binding protein EngB required for normal cell division
VKQIMFTFNSNYQNRVDTEVTEFLKKSQAIFLSVLFVLISLNHLSLIKKQQITAYLNLEKINLCVIKI